MGKHKGVYTRADRKGWLARVFKDGKQVHLGTFESYEEACEAVENYEGTKPAKKDDTHAFMRDWVEYGPIQGSLLWKVDSAHGLMGEDAAKVWCRRGKPTILRVSIGTESYSAADVCWYLKTGCWPEHGVVFADKSKTGRRNLKWSNLRKRMKPVRKKKDENEMLKDLIRDVISGDWSVTILQEAIGDL